jgi:putative two-component system response regulator
MITEPHPLNSSAALPPIDEVDDLPITVVAIHADEEALANLRQCAEREGFRLHPTVEPTRFTALIELVRPDVLAVEVGSPLLDGFGLCRALKARHSTRQVPVVAFGATEASEVGGESLASGSDDFVSRSAHVEELGARLRALGAERRITVQLLEAESVIEGIAHIVEARDPSTGDHCDRLARRAGRFGRWLGLGPAECVALERAGVLHDIGKIAIPDAVLFKPGKLDEAEWEVMRRHPVVGAELLEGMSSMHLIVPIVRHHHERWDGAGYPDRLAGTAIPSLARIFQVVDAFDALTSVRPYKGAMSSEEALSVIEQEGRTGKWDQRVTASFARFLVEDGSDIDERP